MGPDADFPAAHSMDTDWFAVDRDGRVALFRSGESGAVPEGAPREEDHDLIAKVTELKPIDEPVYRLHAPAERSRGVPERRAGHHVAILTTPGLIVSATGLLERWLFGPGGSGLGPVLLFLNSLDPAREDIERGLAVRVPSADAFAVTYRDLPHATAFRLHEAGACLGCRQFYGSWEVHPERLGLFVYDNPDDFSGNPYERRAEPLRFLHVDQLSEELREAALRLTFESLCFEDAPRIQPIDHVPCSTWDCCYLDMDGQTVRAVPGREREYRDWYESVEGVDLDPFHAEPPPPLPPEDPR